ncbi:MAG: hypothetical protein ABW321_28110 [Polyangiales bacterium]
MSGVSFRCLALTSSWIVCTVVVAASGCEESPPAAITGVEYEPAATDDPFAADPAEPPALCRRDNDDAVRSLFCGAERPAIGNLGDLQRLLGFPVVEAGDTSLDAYADAAGTGFSSVTLLSHSTALSGRVVSPLNPRAIIQSENAVMAFSRGVQQVEIAARDAQAYRFNFYLIHFEQSCNAAEGGCKPGDLFTPRIESDWSRVAIQDDEDLKNSPSDCRQCHQRSSRERSDAMLLMRELEGPWTHFFAPDLDDQSALPFNEPNGKDLVRDYLAAKGDEGYAGVPTPILRSTVGFTLERVVSNAQPLLFQGGVIMNERWPYSPEGYAATPQRSQTWYAAYDAFKRGEQLALPYYEPRVTDPGKQATLTQAYRDYMSGALDAQDLPDLAEIFPDDPQVRAEIGLQTEPDAPPVQLLIQACGMCHNDVLDQDLSRARFNIAIGRLPPREREIAISRLQAPADHPGAMPPRDRRSLDDAARARLIDYLKRDSRSDEDDAQLEHAATHGMAVQPPMRRFLSVGE